MLTYTRKCKRLWFSDTERHTELHEDFKKAIAALRVDFIADEGVLRVLTKDESSQRRAGMLQEMHFR